MGVRRQLPVVQREHGDDRLQRARRTEQVAVQGLGRADAQLADRVAPHGAQRFAFDHVADLRRGAVGVAVADLGRRQARRAQRAAQCTRLARGVGFAEVGGITAHAPAGQLGIGPGAAASRTLGRFEHHERCAFTEHEAAAVGSERPARRGRLAGREAGQRLHRLPGQDDTRHDQRFAATDDGHIDLVALHRLGRLGDRHARGGAGDRIGQHRALGAMAHRDMRCRGVGHESRNRQRWHPPARGPIGRLQRRGTPHAAADEDADTLGVEVGAERGVLDRQVGRRDGELADPVDTRQLQLGEPARFVEGHGGRGHRFGQVGEDLSYRRLAAHQRREGPVGIVTVRRDQADAGDPHHGW